MSSLSRPTAVQIAERLWPPPDPVNFRKRQIVADVASFDRRLRTIKTLRERLDVILFDELHRTWIYPGQVAILFGYLLTEVRALVGIIADARDHEDAIHLENSIRFCDEMALERQEKARAHG